MWRATGGCPGNPLVAIGEYDPERNAYLRRVVDAAGPNVLFPGAIYDESTLAALRFSSCRCIHGHSVGGTNPSVVEALGAGNPVLAHDNPFNRWIARTGARFFRQDADCAAQRDEILGDAELRKPMGRAILARHSETFTYDRILAQYEALLLDWQG